MAGSPPPRAYVATFGCRVNQADSDGIIESLRAHAVEPAADHRDADLVVINSCTVTHRSDADIRKLVHRVHRENPNAQVIVSGCYAQRDPEALTRLPGVAAVVGTADAPRIGAIAKQLLGRGDAGVGPLVIRTAVDAADPEDLPPIEPLASVHDRTRPFLKIQEGCDAACTYCIIPSVRGPARSAAPEKVIAAVEKLISQGYFEIVLAGIHLGTYGQSVGSDRSFAELVEELLALPGLGRLRLSCIEPMAFPLRLAELASRDRKLAPHFHLPLQSGSDRILKRMVRPYRAAEFRAQIAAIRSWLPEACLGTDVIVGFPGETEEDFAATVEVVAESGLDYAHIFSYSDRPGVPSTRLSGKVDPRVIKDRSARLHLVARERWAAFLDRQVGRRLSAITLGRHERAPGSTQALSEAYCPITIEDAELAPNRAVQIRIVARDGEQLRGRLHQPLPVLA